MKDYIIISGRKVRVEANWNALTAFLAAKGADTLEGLSNLSTLKPTDIAPLMAACVNEGERLEGNTVDYTGVQIGEVCGITEMAEFISIYTRQTSPVLPATSEKKG